MKTFCSAIFGIFLMLAPAAWPQTGMGTVRGTVRDQSGAVIPGAALALTNTATNLTQKNTSNEAGLYIFPAILPGAYRLTIDASGMQTFEAAVTVQVQQVSVVDAVLTVAGVATQVSVEAVTPLVVTESPTLGQVLERRRIEQLPINGRGIASLLSVVPGLTGSTSYARAYGMRAGSSEIVIDGSSLTDRNWGNLGMAKIGLESVEEFKVETNSSSARFTRPTSVVVSSRSGTNQIHGSLFETHRSNAIGKARAREDLWTKAPQLIRNEYGGSAGGPVVLPKLYNGKDRTFWFFAFEGSRQVNPSTRTYTVPTEAMRNGDFTNLVDSQGRLSVLYDPWTTNSTTWARQPISYGGRANVIDPARISPLAKFLFSITPLPNYPDVNPLVGSNLYLQVPQWSKTYTFSTRLDHRISENDRAFFRYNQSDLRSRISPPTSNLGHGLTEPNVGVPQDAYSDQVVSFSWMRNFSPTLFNEVLLTGNKLPYHRIVSDMADWAGRLGLTNPLGFGGFPELMQTGLSTYQFDPGNYRSQNQGNATASDNATKIMGRHELEFGGHVRYEQLNSLTGTAQSQGTANFATGATSLWDGASKTNPSAAAYTGHNLANLFLGVANYSVRFQRGAYYIRDQEYALYFQDDFKVNSRLTLNLGVRWEYWSELKEKDRLMTSFDTSDRTILLGRTLDEMYARRATLPQLVSKLQSLDVKFKTFQGAGLSDTLMKPNWKNIGPRLGFAWRLMDGARAPVLRGGYRISYFRIPLTTWVSWTNGNTPLTAVLSASVTDAAFSPDGVRNYAMRSVPSIVAGVNSTNAVSLDATIPLSRGAGQARYFAPEQPDTRAQDWNLTFEKEIFPNTLARAAYVGNHVGRLPQLYRYNESTPDYIWYATTGLPTPGGAYANVARRGFDQNAYGDLMEFRRTGWSNYNGAQLELQRNYSRGFGFHLFYVMSNALGTGNQAVDDVSQVSGVNMFMPGLVPDDYDARNRLLTYQRDSSVVKHQVRWNWIADLPFGRGKWIGNQAHGLLNGVIGGWQIAGTGSLQSNYFSLPTGTYPTGNQVELYGYKYPIEDCRSGRCYPGYLWWNGYIPANQINSYDASGKPNGVMGVPAEYKPSTEPLIPWPQVPNSKDPMYSYYGTNTVWVPMKDGSLQRTTFNDGLHPWRQQFLPGVRQWGLSASLFKFVPITERVVLRFNADFFNVLNHPGNPNSIGSDGVLNVRNSGNSAREVQLTLRLAW